MTAPSHAFRRGAAAKRALAGLVDAFLSGWGGQECGRLCSRILSPPPAAPLVLRRRLRIADTAFELSCDVSRWSGNELFLLGRHYEPRSLRFWARACHEADAVIDIGANVGLFAALAAAVRPGRRVVAVEPDPANLSLLRQNLAPYPSASILEGALVPEQGGGIGNWVENPMSGGYRFIPEAEKTDVPVPPAAVPISFRSGDLRRETGAADRILLKLDVEGQEDSLLRQSAFWEALRPAWVLVEITAENASREEATVRSITQASGLKGKRLESLLSLPSLRRRRLANWIFSRYPLPPFTS